MRERTAIVTGLIGLVAGALFNAQRWFGAISGLLLFALAGWFVGWFWPRDWSAWLAPGVAALLGFFLMITVGLRPFG